MAAPVARSLNSSARAHYSEPMLAVLFGCGALLVVAIGVMGLLGPSWPRRMLEAWINIHVLFGLLLCGLVFARCRWCVGHSPAMRADDIRGLSRHLSRIVYLILYSVIGAREIIYILSSLWHDGAINFNLFDQHIRNGPDHAGWNPKDDFQLLFASGLFALVFLRVLAYGLWLRCGKRAAASKLRPRIPMGPASKKLEIGNR